MKMIIGILYSVVLFIQSYAVQAGTVGMSGQWTFDGIVGLNDVMGNTINTANISGVFDFDTGAVSLSSYAFFYGFSWGLNGSVSDNLDGSYFGDLVTTWSVNTFNTDMLWDITDNGDGTASLFTLDGDNDGYIGIAITDGPWVSWNPHLEGTLTAVPLPATLWLMISGVVGLFGFGRKLQRAQ